MDIRRMAKSSPHIWIENYAIGSFNKVRFQKKFIKPIYAMMADIFWIVMSTSQNVMSLLQARRLSLELP